jgi:hypothetical protein
MTTMSRDHAEGPMKSRTCWLDEQRAEVSFLLPGWQAAEMERLAHSRDLTLGQPIRLLIRDYLTDQTALAPISKRRVAGMAMPRGDRFVSQDDSP